MHALFRFLLCLFVGLSACSSGAVRSQMVQSASPPIKPATVAVSPAVLVHELPGAPEGDTVHTGLYVGNLVFSGGFITEDREIGLQNRSREHERKAEELFAQTAVDHTNSVVQAALDAHRIVWQPWQTETVPGLRWSALRGTHPEDGSDNIPLPRWVPVQEPVTELDEWPDADAVMVPYIVHYYSHNGGWFLGQTYGTGAGARYRVVLATWDRKTGRPLGFTDVTARLLHERVFQPNSGQVEDFLIVVEKDLAHQLKRSVWKQRSR